LPQDREHSNIDGKPIDMGAAKARLRPAWALAAKRAYRGVGRQTLLADKIALGESNVLRLCRRCNTMTQ
jgi:hypothetical protein